MATREALLVLLAVVLTGAQAFLATPLNTSDPDVVHILCPEQTTGVTRDHKWITREAIRRNLRQFFLDYPPELQPDFNVPTTASLTELYHAYYGAAASPARFIKAVNSIAASNVRADSASQTKYDPHIQADGEDLPSLQTSMASRYPQILTSILKDEAYSAARSYLGLSLHSLQKFYSHSTWIEQGNNHILEDLGLPGFSFSNLAEAADDVCTPCPSAQGGCSNNVVKGMGITTGFYQYDDPLANSFLVPKPTSGGKCSHGGVLDDSAAAPAEGGINKDTASPCFSPHYQLHSQAAELAVQATDHYLNVVLDAVGNEKYRRLFDLYHGSTLAISIDTTGSMAGDIAAVKQQVAQIVASTTAEMYILAPFHDPGVGPGLKTDDPVEFMDAVNALRAGGGSGSLEERFWGGLQLALSMTPNYGNIFCFTDQGGNDGELMEGDIALAQQQHNKVTIIYSNTVRKGERKDTRWEDFITGPEEYMYLADATGGLFITSDKFDIDAITPILSDGVESTDVDVTMLKDLSGPQDIELPIDDSIFDFQIRLAGSLTTGILKDITGTTYDLMDETALTANPNIEVVAYSPGLKAIRWLDPRYGTWTLHTDASSIYSIVVSANSTLSFLGEFAILDPRPPHPHYEPIIGRPLINTVYYLDVILVGYLESDVTDVFEVEYVDKSGSLLRTIPYHGDIDDEFYIRSEPLPEQPFYIKLYGHVQSGNKFSRLMSVIMSPVETTVKVVATADDLSARPGEKTQADFEVSNYGLDSYFEVTGTDDKGFLYNLSPHRVYLKRNASGTVTGDFNVPFGEIPGTISIITITAKSETQTQSVNSAIANFLVLPEESESSPPTCITASSPDCTGFDLNGVCQGKNWTIQATLQDTGAGMGAVYVRPDGFQTNVQPFTAGTISPITVTYTASCCVSQVDVIGVDVQGNVGKCQIDMGTLGGYVMDFEAVDVGTTWVEVCWSITPTKYELHKYSLLIDDDFTTDVRCKELSCCHNVTYLDPCTPHTFQLTPVFLVDGRDREGQAAYTDASTLDDVPGPPENAEVVGATETTATIQWSAKNTKCISQYQVCYRTFGVAASQLCERTTTSTYKMLGLEACTMYEVTITSLSPLGLPSPDALSIFVNTEEALPGAPKNMKVPTTTVTTARITWEDPDDHAQCVDRYLVSFKKTDLRGLDHRVVDHEMRILHEVTLKPLDGCTNYTFDVAALSKSGNVGPLATRYGATEESDPLPVWGLSLNGHATDSLTATWEFSDLCVDHFLVCYYDEEEIGEVCTEIYDNKLTVNDLLACTTYHVSVSTVTPSGFVSNRTQEQTDTQEMAPGAPKDMRIIKESAHSIDVRYNPPDVNPQCTNEYDYRIIDKGTGRQMAAKVARQTRLDSVFMNLMACTEYEAQIRAVSTSGLASPWVSAHGSTIAELPSKPQELQVRYATTTSLDVIWFHPLGNPRCVTQYILEWNGNTQIITGDLSNEANAILAGLAPCTSYDLKVTPVSSVGNGPPATLSASTLCWND